MSTQKNLITLCFAAVFTLGLAACGGGGGGGGAPVTGMPDTIEPIELEAHACDADAGSSQACVDARQAELEAIKNDSDATVGALNAAEMALDTAQTALADANTAAAEEMTVSGLVDDAMTATADITDESTPAEVAVGRAAIDAAQESLGGMENLSADATAALQGRIDALEAGYSPIEMTVRMAAATAAAAAVQLPNAQAAVADAQALVATLTAASSNSDRAAAYSSLAAAQAALAEASGIPENEITLLKAEIARLQEVIDQAAMDAQTEADRIAAEMADEADRIAALVAGTKSAETKEKAIGVEAGETGEADAGIGGSLMIDEDTTYSMTISRDRDGTKITIADTANPADADPANPQFAQAMDLGGGRTMHVRAMDANDEGEVVEEVVIVSTDIDAPTAKPFADVHGLDTNPNTADPAVNQSLVVLTANVGMWSSSEFPSTPDTMRDYPEDDTATEDVNEAAIDGKFDGADGTFVCLDDNCSIATDKDGKLETVVGVWRFTPDEKVTVDVADADYLNYGFWLMRTTDADGAVTYNEVETFAGATVGGVTEGSAGPQLNDVEGSATYEGGATGVYVHSEVNSDGSRVATTAGQFAADASLTAYFGGHDVAVNMQNTVTGTISNFALEHGEANTWAVNLKGTRAMGVNVINGDMGATGGGGPGHWSGTFHGATPATPATTDDADVNVAPGAVVGEFNANFSNGSAVGGFGARKQ